MIKDGVSDSALAIPTSPGRETLVVLSQEPLPYFSRLRQVWASENLSVGNSVEALQSAASNATVILNWSGSRDLLRKVFLQSPNLRWIHSRSVGLERSLFQEIMGSTIVLTNGRGVFSPSLGEFAVAAILYFAKDLRRMVRSQANGVWDPFDVQLASGHTVGIVGYGDIGRQVATRVRALGMKVVAVKRHVTCDTDGEAGRIYSSDSLLEMLSLCDYVVVAVPLTQDTKGMIGERELNAMRNNAVVINLGRGPVIHEEALVRALTTHRIKGAALDVFDREPLPALHPFYTLENVLLSPHCADHIPGWLDDAMLLFLEQLERYRNGQPLLNVVDKVLGY